MSNNDEMARVWLISAEIMSQLGGGHRQQRWCEYFLQRGWPIRIYSQQGPLGIKTVEVTSVEELRKLRKQWTSSTPPRAGVRIGFLASIGRKLKHLLLIDLWLPSQFKLYRLMAMDLRNSGCSVVFLCSSPPFAVAVVAALLKLRFSSQVALVLDMRDLWSLHDAHPGPKLHKRMIEQWVMSQVEILTTVSHGLAKRFKSAFGKQSIVAYNVATHVSPANSISDDSLDWTNINRRLSDTSTKFLYTGSLPQGYYDLYSFAAAIQKAGVAISDKQFVFVGACGELEKNCRRLGVPEDRVIFVGQVDQVAAQKLQRAADAVIFFGFVADDNQGQVSIKLFEYMRNKKPVLPLNIAAGSDVDSIIRKYCGSMLYLSSVEDMATFFAQPAAKCLSRLPVACNSLADQELLQSYEQTVEKVISIYLSPS